MDDSRPPAAPGETVNAYNCDCIGMPCIHAYAMVVDALEERVERMNGRIDTYAETFGERLSAMESKAAPAPQPERGEAITECFRCQVSKLAGEMRPVCATCLIETAFDAPDAATREENRCGACSDRDPDPAAHIPSCSMSTRVDTRYMTDEARRSWEEYEAARDDVATRACPDHPSTGCSGSGLVHIMTPPAQRDDGPGQIRWNADAFVPPNPEALPDGKPGSVHSRTDADQLPARSDREHVVSRKPLGPCAKRRAVTEAGNTIAVAVAAIILGHHTETWIGWCAFLSVGALMPQARHLPVGCTCAEPLP